MTYPLANLAHALGARVVDGRIVTAAGIVYSSLTGRVRLQRDGAPVSDLGAWYEPTDRLAASYRAQIRATR